MQNNCEHHPELALEKTLCFWCIRKEWVFEALKHAYVVFSCFFSKCSSYCMVLIANYRFSHEYFGVFVLLMLTVSIITDVVQCGGGLWFNRFIERQSLHQSPVVSTLYVKISLGLLGICLTLGGIVALCTTQYALLILMSVVFGSMKGLTEAFLSILRTTNNIFQFFFIKDLFLPCILLCICFLAPTVFQFFLFSALFVSVLSVVLLCILLKRRHKYFPSSHCTWKNRKKMVLHHTFGIIGNNASSRLFHSVDVIFLSLFCSTTFAGQYRLISYLANGFIVMQNFICLSLPWHFKQSQQGEKRDSKVSGFHQYLLFATSAIALGILICNKTTVFSLLRLQDELMNVDILFILLFASKFLDLLWGAQDCILITNNNLYCNIGIYALGMLLFFLFNAFSPLFFPVCYGVSLSFIVSNMVVKCLQRFVIERCCIDQKYYFSPHCAFFIHLLFVCSAIGFCLYAR